MNFKWKGLKSNAFVDGVIDSINKDEAMFLLKKDGVIVTSIINSNPKDEKKKKTTKILTASAKVKIADQELLLFTRKLTTMMKAGLAIVPALKMLEQQSENPKFSPIILTCVH